MPKNTVTIPPPLHGLSDDTAFADQDERTTRKSLNARALDPLTGTRRISQRSGMTRFISPDAQISGANKIQELTGITKNEDLLTYADQATPPNVFAKALEGPLGTGGNERQGDCVDLRMDEFGDLYAAQRVGGVFKFNQDGELLAEMLIPESDDGGRIEISCIAVDEFGNCAVGTGGETEALADCRLYLFENRLDGTYRLAWTLNRGTAFFDVGFYQGNIYTLDGDALPEAFTGGTQTARFRVYPNYTLLSAPSSDSAKSVNITLRITDIDATHVNAVPTRMAIRDDGVVYITGSDTATTPSTVREFVAKINPNGENPQRFVNDSGTPWFADTTADDQGGFGYGIAIGPKNTDGLYTIYTYGARGDAASDVSEVRRILDTGPAPDYTGTGTWEQSLTEPSALLMSAMFMRMDTDVDGNLYFAPPTANGFGNQVEIRLAADGTDINGFSDTSNSTPGLGIGGPAVAVTKEDKPKGSTSESVEFVFWGMRETNTTRVAFLKQRMLTVTQTGTAMRSVVKLAVANGDIKTFTSSAVATPTGGSGALDSGAPHIMSASLGRKVYFTDGITYQKYDVEDDEVTAWLSETSGPIPPRCRLVETWRGRMVLARDPEDPQQWHMSAVGLANDWDNFPAVSTVTQAISGVNAKAGKVPDIVNAIIPWDDDLCLFGCDHSIWRLTGDPLAGGQFHLVSDQTGMAFGRCWAKDPTGGRMFFFGSRGGVYMMERNSYPVRISRDRIERRLQNVDLSSTYVRLVWNYRDEGLHVFQLPFGAGGTILKHWFWDAKTDGWWEDRYGKTGSTGVQPTSVFLFDGDTQSDRVILMGGEDGRIRVWDEAAVDDDTEAIAWEVQYGPFVSGSQGREWFFDRLTAVLARDQQGAQYRCFSGDHPDDVGLQVASGMFEPGRNSAESARWRGANAWMTISNSMPGQRCSVETLEVGASRRGRTGRGWR